MRRGVYRRQRATSVAGPRPSTKRQEAVPYDLIATTTQPSKVAQRDSKMTAGQTAIALVHSLLLGILLSCGGSSSGGPPPPPPTAECASATYFPCQQGWLGADGAYSVPLGNG